MRSVAWRALLPSGTFVTVLGLHTLWSGLFPEQDPLQAGWVVLPEQRDWLQVYVETQAYWLGYAYALSAAFGAAALAGFLHDRSCATRNSALGGVTLSGVLALSGCFLVGCCGSPMLAVWLGLFGARFLPFAKPFVALLTTAMILCAWLWLAHRRRNRPALSCPAVLAWDTEKTGAPTGDLPDADRAPSSSPLQEQP